jgi:hypothetical protein
MPGAEEARSQAGRPGPIGDGRTSPRVGRGLGCERNNLYLVE